MKKFLLPALFALCLTACGSGTPTTLTYHVTMDSRNPDRMDALSLATRHVMERRLARIEGRLFDYDVDYDKDSDVITISAQVDSKESADTLNAEMTAPFSFEVRRLVDDGTQQEGDIEVENMGFFRATGITKEDVDWVIGQTIEGTSQGRVLIGFREDSLAKVQKFFDEYPDTKIGMFARDRLIAAISKAPEDFKQVIAIEGLPTGELAKVFADDMNVGIHMTFKNI